MARSIVSFIRNWLGMLSMTEAVAIAALVALSAAAISYIELERSWSIQTAQERYIEESHRATVEIADTLGRTFRQIYQGMRTIARLPGVREIDRYGKNFDNDARRSVQEIYNNLSENVALSELYIVPVDFEPDEVDSNTGRLQEPITTFDELIVGRNADTETDKGDTAAAETIEEIEIFEYRAMKSQIAIIERDYFHESSIQDLAYPAIASEEVITCDNTRYSPAHPDDNSRKGIVYSIPFYGRDGKLRGIISAVILTDVLRELLPGGMHAIHARAYRFVAGSGESGVWKAHLDSVLKDLAANDLIYSQVEPLRISDIHADWKLWAGRHNDEFLSSIAVAASNERADLRKLIVALTSIALLFGAHLMASQQRMLVARNEELEARVGERTRELKDAKDHAVETDASKTAFLANISHEIRTPMNAIMGMSELLAQNNPSPSQARQLRVIHKSSEALLSLMNQILDLSAIETGKVSLVKGPCSPSLIVDEVIGLFNEQANAKGLALSASISNEVPEYVIVDGGRLRQVLVNLVNNAIKFSDSGGVVIDVRLNSAHEKEAVTLWFSVSDNGKGIDPNAGRDVFDEFRRGGGRGDELSGSNGSGLGLSICRRLVELMGGFIDYESVPQKGTTFFFTIAARVINEPERDTALADENVFEAFSAPADSFATKHVLLVEDNETMRDLMAEILVSFGCKVSSARDGQEAVQMFDTTSFDIIFMDCRMPVMNGYRASETIRRRERQRGLVATPIIALTANAFAHDEAACFEAGMTGFLAKPVSARQIFEAIADGLATS